MANLKIGDEALTFSLPNAKDGKEVSYVDYGDKVARAVIFWCNHCPYVQAWEDRIIQLQKDVADKGIQFILISANDAVQYPEDSFDQMKARAVMKNYPFPYLYDETQEVAHAYGAERTPEIFLFNQANTLVYHGAPDDNYDQPTAVEKHYFYDALHALLDGHVPSTPNTDPIGCTVKWKES